ncbi:hypothetical protein Y032_0070g416 [Ancylostoma ceylanicum]|uniref:Uncharacterized protein n=1 Tax=Ancylostoma ceylanicum TaxID=53326 RepID=A0A016TXQ5_9BILA|nr:hypothetical protein Y032_0070g416 [Ancylostoma ceylanicum]
MHSRPAAKDGRSTTHGKDSTTAEYYQNIARIVDQTITDANRLLNEMGRKRSNANQLAGNKAEPPPDKEAKEKSGAVPSSSESTRVSAGSCSMGSSTRGFRNYVDTPSRMRSYSKPKSMDHQCFCASGRKIPACACSRELEQLYASALKEWVSSSRSSANNSRSSTPLRSRSGTSSTRKPNPKLCRGDAGSSGRSSPRMSSAPPATRCSVGIVLRKPQVRKHAQRPLSSTRTAVAPSKPDVASGSAQDTSIELPEDVKNNGSARKGYVTIMHADNVYFKCSCGRICPKAQPKSTSVQLCVGKSSELASEQSSSPRKAVAKKRVLDKLFWRVSF